MSKRPWRATGGFNEAPAERGGERPRPPRHVRADGRASMRPPLNAGENNTKGAPFVLHTGCFNEAPAERGGERG